MVKIYGSILCPDCVLCRNELDAKGIFYEYLDISEDLRNFKEFLKLRDTQDAFAEIRCSDRIGIPCIVFENGTIDFSWEELIK